MTAKLLATLLSKWAMVGAIVLFGRPMSLGAQTAGESAEFKTYCAGLDSLIRNNATGSTYRHGLINIRSCPTETIVASLVGQWNPPPSDTASAHLLGVVTGRIRDRRLLEPVKRAALNAALTRSQRLAALYALAEFYDPNTVVIFRRFNEPGLSGTRYVLVGGIDHPGTEEGLQPFGKEVRREVADVLTALTRNENDAIMRTIASYLQTQLALLQ